MLQHWVGDVESFFQGSVNFCRKVKGTARIASQELAPIHSVKSGILQNVCSTRRVVADLGKSALMRIARLKNSLAKGLKRMVTKVQCLCKNNESIIIEQGDLFLDAYFIKYTTNGLCIPGYGAAEVFVFYGRAHTYGIRTDV